MHVLNSAHVIAAVICGLAALVVLTGIWSLIDLILARHDARAHIEPTEYQTSPYKENDHDNL